jgi:hypothetical protein
MIFESLNLGIKPIDFMKITVRATIEQSPRSSIKKPPWRKKFKVVSKASEKFMKRF